MSVRLFVGNLPYSATEADIRQHFGTIGDPIQVVIPTDRETGRPRGFAFVEMEEASAASDAIRALDGSDLGGRSIKVNEAQDRRGDSGGGFRPNRY